MKRSGASLVTALGLLLLLSLPSTASASATVRYVAKSGTDNATCNPAPCLTIAHAIEVAQAGDTISIGPGTFAEELYVGKSLNFVGAGSGTASTYNSSQDTLVDGSKSTDTTIWDSAGGSFSDLRINGGVEAFGKFAETKTALYLQAAGGIGSDSFNVSDVVATQPPEPSGGSAQPTVVVESVSTYTNTTTITGLTAIGAGEALGLDTGGTVNLTLSHSTLTGGDGGEAAMGLGSANATVSDTTVSGAGLGAILYTGGQLTATRDSFTGRNAGLKLRSYENGASTATLRDSLAAALPTAASTPQAGVVLLSEKAGSTATLSATNSTIVAYGKGATAGLQLESTMKGGTTTAQLANSIAYGDDPTTSGTPDILAEGPGAATVTAESSGYSTVSAKSGATITPVGSAGNVSGNPEFVNPAAGNFMLTSASPLLERGNPALTQEGELDLAGDPRIEVECGRALNPDIGAYELQRAFACPISTGGSGTGSVGTSKATGTPKVPTIESASIFAPLRTHHRKRARAGKLVFTLSEAATVDVTLERSAHGHLRKQACIAKVKACKRLLTITTTRLTSKAGKNTSAFPSLKLVGHLKAGSYEVTLVAVSAQGTRSASRTVKFTLR
jgi:hypothetical protein